VIVWGPSVHTLRVSLRVVEPTVWRRIVVPSGNQAAPVRPLAGGGDGWEGYHLHSFDIAGWQFGTSDEDADQVIDERRVAVKQILSPVASAVQWVYDFGDGWEHDVVAEASEEPSASVRYPVWPDGARACPPEDCRGASGCDVLREVLADPTHEAYERLRGWEPEGFDADHFDLLAVNQRMRARR
jgi:Plasmid pRiA4b ORF-3-like protein